jgi:hypothetical protein
LWNGEEVDGAVVSRRRRRRKWNDVLSTTAINREASAVEVKIE